MKINLNKCKRDDRYIRSDKQKVSFVRFTLGHDDSMDMVKVAYFSDGLYRTMNGRCPFLPADRNIVKKVNTSDKVKINDGNSNDGKKKNIAKYWINEELGNYIVRVTIDNWFFDLPEYSSRNAAIKGVKRFCDRIGFTYEVLENN